MTCGICCFRALKLDSKNHVLFSNRSAAYVGLEQYRKALEDASSCIQISPNFVKGYSRQAYAYLKLNKPGFAEKAYREGLQLDPTYAPLKQGLASLLKVLSLYPEPICLQASLDLNHAVKHADDSVMTSCSVYLLCLCNLPCA